jgi:hypothetical protein
MPTQGVARSGRRSDTARAAAPTNPSGVKGLGKIGIVGVAAAIANAVYHATAKRVPESADHAGQIGAVNQGLCWG